MRRLKIVPTVLLLVVLFVFGSLSYWAVGRVKSETQLFAQIALQKLARAGEINSYQAEGYARTLLLLNVETPGERSALRAAMDDFRLKTDRALDDYATTISTDESRRLLKDLMDTRASYHQIRQQVLELDDQDKKAQALQMARTALWPAYQKYTQAGDLLLDYDVAAARIHADHIRKVCTITQFAAAFITVVGFLGGVLAPFLVMMFGSGYEKDSLRS